MLFDSVFHLRSTEQKNKIIVVKGLKMTPKVGAPYDNEIIGGCVKKQELSESQIHRLWTNTKRIVVVNINVNVYGEFSQYSLPIT